MAIEVKPSNLKKLQVMVEENTEESLKKAQELIKKLLDTPKPYRRPKCNLGGMVRFG